MSGRSAPRTSRHMLVVMPARVSDVVMATATLRALRGACPGAQISVLVRRHLRPLLDPCPWIDRVHTLGPGPGVARRHRPRRALVLARRLAAGRFDTAVLLTNSFRAALAVMLAGIPRRVGYDRDGRGFLLTDRLLARRGTRGFVPVSARDYYLGLARYLGAPPTDDRVTLFTRPEQDQAVRRMLREAGWRDDARPLVLLAPGCSRGDARQWSPLRFAELADLCVSRLDAVVAIGGPARERPVLDRVLAAMREPALDLAALGIDLGLFKSAVRLGRLLISNDTGARHIGAALGVPVVSIFGPTDPAWTEHRFPAERQVRVPVECGPCQLNRCPLDHRCMDLVDVPLVFDRACQLLGSGRASVAT